jgi:hypothetical protein
MENSELPFEFPQEHSDQSPGDRHDVASNPFHVSDLVTRPVSGQVKPIPLDLIADILHDPLEELDITLEFGTNTDTACTADSATSAVPSSCSSCGTGPASCASCGSCGSCGGCGSCGSCHTCCDY